MAHLSGNPTWQDYPSTATLITAGSLENIENGLDALAGPRSVPVVESRLTTSYLGLPGNAWQVMRGQMAVPTGMDPFGMWTKPAGADPPYQIVIPAGWGGRYELFWQICAGNVAPTNLIAASCLNLPDTAANSSNDTINLLWAQSRTPGSGLTQCISSAKFAEGDKLSLVVHYQAAAGAQWNLIPQQPGIGVDTLIRTKVVVRYVGPN